MNKKLMTLNRCDKCHKEIEIYKLNALYSDSFFPNGYICNDCLINYPELGSMLKDSATQMEKIIPKIDEIPIPEEPPKPDPLVECRIRITLIEGGEYTSSLTMKKSQIYHFCNAISDQLSDSKGNLVMRGSVDDINDFCIIPGSNIKFIEFKVFKEITKV